MAEQSGAMVRRARVARGLTQDELARRAGLSRQALGAIESGAYQPGVGAALALARVGGRLVALAQPPPAMRLPAAGGVLQHAAGRRARVAALRTQQEIDATLLVAGCDPAVTILADWMGRHRLVT